MNWWQRICYGTALAFFQGLQFANPSVKEKALPYARETLAALKIVYPELFV